MAVNASWCKHGNEVWTCWKGQEMEKEERGRKGTGKCAVIWRIKPVWLAKESMEAVFSDSHPDPSELWKHRIFGSNIFWKRWQWWFDEQLLMLNLSRYETPLSHITLGSILTIRGWGLCAHIPQIVHTTSGLLLPALPASQNHLAFPA